MSQSLRFQQQYVRAVIAAGNLNLDAITGRIATRFGADAAELDKEVTRAHLAGLFGLLERVMASYKAANDAVDTDTAQDIRARASRTTAMLKLHETTKAGRRRIRENLGEGSLRGYGLDASVPRSDDSLKNYTSRAVTLLGDNPQQAPERFGGQFDTNAIRAAIKLDAEKLDDAMNAEVLEKQETTAARTTRDEVELRFTAALYNTAHILVSHLRMAGLDALAERIRPTVARTRGETEVEVPEQPDPEAEETPRS
jgi:hypothetical protein